jgi:hypothetical protein
MIIKALMMEAANTSETNVYQTTRRNVAEDSHFHTCRRENLKSHVQRCSTAMYHSQKAGIYREGGGGVRIAMEDEFSTQNPLLE